ncbi:hypothetical protein Tco_1335292 [Tanacetum coccineum]
MSYVISMLVSILDDETCRRFKNKYCWCVKVPIVIGMSYEEEVICDVIDLHGGHVLLGNPWHKELDTTYQTFYPEHRIEFYSLKDVSVFPNNMAYSANSIRRIGRDPLEFIPWRNSKLKDHKKVDKTTKCALLYTWIEIGNKGGLLNDEVSSDEEWEEREYGNSPNDSFPKPYLNVNNEKDKNHHNENNRDTNKLSGMDLSGAPQSEKINNKQPNKGVCRVDNFEMIKYMIGGNEEFLAICTRKCNSWAQTVNGVSSIYHDIFHKKDEGWTVHRTK